MMGIFRLTGLTLALVFASMTIQASVYTQAINESAWRSQGSVFECNLRHDVPYYGQVTFKTRAGEKSVFYLNAKSSRFNAGSASLSTRLPIWYNASKESSKTPLGQVPIKKGKRPLWLTTSWAELLLAKLNDGKEIVVAQNQWFETDKKESELVISAIGFRKAYRQYLNCLSGLIPANFDQLKRTALYFSPGETDELPYSLQRKLDNILSLVEHDKDVRVFYIDGHTDSHGERAENLELSKLRAELVATYLERRGVPKNWMTVRWHGERYPVAANATSKGQAKNRRVTVRLERVKKIDVLPLGDEQERSASMSKDQSVQ